ncbi:MAG: hypothetical protein ACOYLB_06475 [Phototrophicaceae bacterium]
MLNARRACLGFILLFISACGASPTPEVILPTLADVTPTFSVITPPPSIPPTLPPLATLPPARDIVPRLNTMQVVGVGQSGSLNPNLAYPGDLIVINPAAPTARPLRLTYDSALESNPTWHPNGERLYFNGNGEGNTYIYYVDVSSPFGAQRLSASPAGNEVQPALSADGTRLVFTSDRSGVAELYSMSAVDGSNLVQLTTTGTSNSQADWSSDDGWIVFVSERDGNPELYLMATDGSQQTRLTTTAAVEAMPAFSPNGDKIAFVSDTSGMTQIHLLDLPLNPPQSDDELGIIPTEYADIDFARLPLEDSYQLTHSLSRKSSPQWVVDQNGLTKIIYSSLERAADGTEFSLLYIMSTDGTGAVALSSPFMSMSQPAPRP